MTCPPPVPVITLSVDAPSTMEGELNAAEATLRDLAAVHRGHGILVTRHGHSSFTVALSPEVPYGITKEAEAPATHPTPPAKQENR